MTEPASVDVLEQYVKIWLKYKDKGITIADIAFAYHGDPKMYISDPEALKDIYALKNKKHELPH